MLLNLQESVPVDSNFALGQVTSVPKEQNLPTLFNEGENSQVAYFTIQEFNPAAALYLFTYILYYITGLKERLCAKHHVDV